MLLVHGDNHVDDDDDDGIDDDDDDLFALHPIISHLISG